MEERGVFLKRIVTIQDISCIGKCSLTVALPIISACGVETAVIPTAVLSTHTAFTGFTFRDLTEEILPIVAHWKREHMTVDAIYTGYLGSFQQLEIVSQVFDQFKTLDNFILVDPAMADNGALYAGFTPEFVKEMAKLCGKADIMVPNLTEACYLLDIPYLGERYTKQDIQDILVALSALGAKQVALTGVSFSPDQLGVMAYDAETGTFFSYYNEKMPASFHGTGDVFASVVVGAMARGHTLWEALPLAVDYTLESIRKTIADPARQWYGVNFEEAIPMLTTRLSEKAHESQRDGGKKPVSVQGRKKVHG